MKVTHRAQLFVSPWTIQSMKFSRPEYWSGIAFPFSRGSSQLRVRTQVSCIANRYFTIRATWEALQERRQGGKYKDLLVPIWYRSTLHSQWSSLYCQLKLFLNLIYSYIWPNDKVLVIKIRVIEGFSLSFFPPLTTPHDLQDLSPPIRDLTWVHGSESTES